ncbi:MAG: S9 family peptidase [Planctomycetes bacterium]|nr:S9 family peptidase [Planctomycetota bacterium]
MSRTRVLLATALVAFLLLPASLRAQNMGEDPVAWMYGPEARTLGLTQEHKWLDDGSLLHWEYSRRGILEQGLMRWDPKTGESQRVLALRPVLQAFAQFKVDARGVYFPEEFSADGSKGLYAVAGDLFVCTIPAGELIRVTETPEVEEKSAHFSPDGKKLAFVRRNDLYVVDLTSGVETRLSDGATDLILNGTLPWVYWEEIFGRQDTGYWWSPDSSRIAFLHSDETAVGVVPIIDWEPDYPTVREQRYPRTGTTNPKVEVRVVELKEGAKPVTLPLAAPDELEEYVIRVNWLPKSPALIVQTMNRAQNAVALQRVDLDAGEGKLASSVLMVEQDKGWVHPHDDLVVTPDESHFFWVSERDGWAHAYLYEIGGKLVGQVTKGEFALRSASALYWMRQAIQHADWEAKKIWVQSLEGSSIENHLWCVDLKTGERSCLTPDAGTHVISFSPDGRHFIDEHSRGNLPPRQVIRDLEGKELAVLTERRGELLEAKQLVFPEFHRVPARDGFQMPAYLVKPQGFDPEKRYPVVIYGYGGPSAPSVADKWDGNDLYWANVLCANGFLVFCVDNRSAAAASKEDENTILGQMYGDGEVNDLIDGVKWLKAQPWVDDERVGIWGWSGGGTLTMLAMTNSKEFRAGIAVAGVTRWQYYDTLWAEASLKRPQDNPAGYSRCDLAAQAGNLHGKLLLVHGTADDNVHVQNAWAFANGLIESGKLFEMMIYPNRDHSIADLSARLHLYHTMLDFWDRNLKN